MKWFMSGSGWWWIRQLYAKRFRLLGVLQYPCGHERLAQTTRALWIELAPICASVFVSVQHFERVMNRICDPIEILWVNVHGLCRSVGAKSGAWLHPGRSRHTRWRIRIDRTNPPSELFDPVCPGGALGPQTLAAARAADGLALKSKMLGARLQFMTDLTTWPSFGKGWARRIASLMMMP